MDFVTEVSVTCPFCDDGRRMYHVGREFGGRRCVVMHDSPPCPEFIAMEVVDFLVAARKKLGIVMPDENN